jgi:urea carboxylase
MARVTVEVLSAGTQTTVQDLPGRQGLWGVGVPPSGAWDDLSFALANRAVGNPVGAAGLEAVLRGPVLRFRAPVLVCVAGAATQSTVDGVPLAPGRPVEVGAGQTLDLGAMRGPGLRGYLTVAGGLAVPETLGSRSTFLLGGFGGFAGRPLRTGDALPFGDPDGIPPLDVAGALPVLTDSWTIRVVPGPHGAPDYLTGAGVAALFETAWRLDHRSDRTGVRLLGPVPEFAREDGGEAGLHPSNIHDSAYPVGAVMLSGGTPVIVGPDGPSLGGFVVPAVVIRADRWRLAQCRPGDRIRLLPVTPEQADEANADRARLLDAGAPPTPPRQASYVRAGSARPTALLDLPADADRPALTARRAGDHHLLVEVGPAELDLAVRLRVHLLAGAVGRPPGVVESVEGVRSLLLAVEESRLPVPALAERVAEAWYALPELSTVEVAAREVALPIAFDDPAAHEAMTRYQTSVRWDAPWCPDNVEFIRRVNGLRERREVFDIVAAATYLVVGLGDVYLGAPVAVPLDPAHRLVTTKYDPPRTWTPANAVGIGGAYLCVYGMSGPGGYQLLGRTVPVWRTGGRPPWLLRHFDLLRFHPVSPAELLDLRADVEAGRRELVTRPRTLRLSDLVHTGDPAAGEFTARRRAAFAAERDRWALAIGSPV